MDAPRQEGGKRSEEPRGLKNMIEGEFIVEVGFSAPQVICRRVQDGEINGSGR